MKYIKLTNEQIQLVKIALKTKTLTSSQIGYGELVLMKGTYRKQSELFLNNIIK